MASLCVGRAAPTPPTRRRVRSQVMEIMNGGELFDRVVAKEKYTEREAAGVIRDIARALAYCHEHRIAHRDLKVPCPTLSAHARTHTAPPHLVPAPASPRTCCTRPRRTTPPSKSPTLA